MKAKKSRFARDCSKSTTEIAPAAQEEQDDYMSEAYLPVGDAASVDRINPKQRSFAEMTEMNKNTAMAAPIDTSNKGFKVKIVACNNALILFFTRQKHSISQHYLKTPPHMSNIHFSPWHHRNDNIHYELPSSL